MPANSRRLIRVGLSIDRRCQILDNYVVNLKVEQPIEGTQQRKLDEESKYFRRSSPLGS